MQISEEIIEVLEYLCEKLGVTIDWTSQNVLPYLEQLCNKFIAWEISTSFAWIAIMGFITIATLVAAIIIHKTCDMQGVEWVIFGGVCIISISVIGCQIFDIIECNTFPEKTIYDYIKYHINLKN